MEHLVGIIKVHKCAVYSTHAHKSIQNSACNFSKTKLNTQTQTIHDFFFHINSASFDCSEPRQYSDGIFSSYFPPKSASNFKRLDFSTAKSTIGSVLTAICLLCAFLCIFLRWCCCWWNRKNNTTPTIFLFSLDYHVEAYIFRLKHEMMVAVVEWVLCGAVCPLFNDNYTFILNCCRSYECRVTQIIGITFLFVKM